ncbi:class I SAM-dependent methyltransferase [Rhodoferax sp.]|uniref:class I SAM-dependent methyltransferase n=1 Tax=Rhodoferax sp. TaxID=50421 RepID=UPI00271BBAEA|nr:SAM-dependent methyltransferase [Rhodoferax sp.]MDO9196263.1 SAM-dependent methyltransferase [Rhodoferax sp.]
MTTPYSLTSALSARIAQAIAADQGWIGFDAFMALALYTPGLGYYANDSAKFGTMPARLQAGVPVGGSDFVTAPEMTPLFGQTLAAQVAQALQVTQTAEVWEFGAGSGALALQLLETLEAMGLPLARYSIVDLSGSLRARQQETLARFAGTVRWVGELPDTLQGVVLGNEVLDAMPVKLLARVNGVWYERGVALDAAMDGQQGGDAPRFVWHDRPTELRPPLDIERVHDYLTEIHPQAESFVRTLADRLTVGAAFLIDYGFPEHEYYHPQRHMGTVMCHRSHRSDPDPLSDVGLKDITAHVNFTGIALAAQEAGLNVLGYCTQARFLINCGLVARMETAPLAVRVQAQKLIMEHEMGELFKVIGLYKGDPWEAIGFSQGDRTHTL